MSTEIVSVMILIHNHLNYEMLTLSKRTKRETNKILLYQM